MVYLRVFNMENNEWKVVPRTFSQKVKPCNKLCPAERKRSEDHSHSERQIQHLHSGGPGSGAALHRDHRRGEGRQDGCQEHDNVPDL